MSINVYKSIYVTIKRKPYYYSTNFSFLLEYQDLFGFTAANIMKPR